MTYKLEITPRARRDLKKLSQDIRERIRQRIEKLMRDPRPRDATKMEGMKKLYRVREGDYRIIYEIRDRVLLIVIVRVGHRKEVYRDVRIL